MHKPSGLVDICQSLHGGKRFIFIMHDCIHTVSCSIYCIVFPGLKQWVMFCSFCPFGCLTVLSPVLYRTYSLVSDHLKIVHIWNIQHVIDIEI
jgi:hypothetical protein